ncbi:MAG TPA: hypothetical protein VGK87_00575 [Anaerolineae bacterium]|jgi:hypothetical protein
MAITNLFQKVIASGVIMSTIIGGGIAAPSIIAQAQQTNPPAVSTPAAASAAKPVVARTLAQVFRRELRVQHRQGIRLEHTGKVVTRVEHFIDTQSKAGKDVSALKTALEAYKVAVNKARAIHEAAGDILEVHAGFVDGKVVDRAAAKTTVTTAAVQLKLFAKTMNQANKALRDAIKDWKQSHTI